MGTASRRFEFEFGLVLGLLWGRAVNLGGGDGDQMSEDFAGRGAGEGTLSGLLGSPMAMA